MRWLLPLLLVVVLAVCAADDISASARKRARTGLDGPAWMHPEVPPSGPVGGHDQAVTASEDPQAAALQTARFDAATGTLTWFDDDERYN
jgi:hypothetical protein